jgi:excisionase family DNA binding protein
MQRPLNIAEAADGLGVTPRFVRRLVAERRIPFLKVGRHVRFDPDDSTPSSQRAVSKPSGMDGRSVGVDTRST